MNIRELKQKYNYWLKRNNDAEKYFSTKTVAESLKYLELFNKISRELSKLMVQFKTLTGREMTSTEKLNGFTNI
jgi:hypothetical protein